MPYKIKQIDIQTSHFEIVMHIDDAKDMGLRSADRVKVLCKDKSAVSVIDTTSSVVEKGEVGLYRGVFKHLGVADGDVVKIYPTKRPASIEHIKKKLNGGELTKDEVYEIIDDISNGNLSDVEISAYVCSTYSHGMNMRETEDLTRAMVESGDKLEFEGNQPVMDFHSVGGAPGNKITLIVVPIIMASGLLIPKTSSRAISSACGTADILETICRVDLSLEEIKKQTLEIGGTIAWGGAVNIAPADDIIIRAEYPLSIDPYPQVLASVMAKKVAGGANYLVMDIPTGSETKVPDIEYGRKYARDFIELGERLGIKVECALTFGGQPIGNAIGPSIEIKEALECLEGKEVPNSLLSKATNIAGIVLEQGHVAAPGKGREAALELIKSGKALEKWKQLLKAQGGDPSLTSETIKLGEHFVDIMAPADGYVQKVHNKTVVKIVRAAGAPHEKGAGMYLFAKEGDKAVEGEPLYRIYSDTEAKLNMAKTFAQEHPPVEIEGMILERVPSYREI